MPTTTCDFRRSLVVLAAAAVLARAAPAAAQADDQAAARVLFNDARQLMGAGHYDEACPKLEAAAKLYAGSGVLLNLGDCYEHTGRTASAWTEFGEAASTAERLGHTDDRAEATRRQAAIEPRLTRVTVRVASETPGLVVKRDGAILDRGAWGTAIPVDPGTHAISASAPGRQPWSTSVQVDTPGQTQNVDVPVLDALPAAAPPASAVPAAPAAIVPPVTETRASFQWTGRRTTAAVVAGAGALGLAAGGVAGLVALSQYNRAYGEGSPQRHDDSVTAVNTSNVATVIVAVGGVVLVSGVVLWLTAPASRVQVGANGAGAVARVVF